jgi:2-polyprenyl-3-methyl-5-hydroxy-6-metoxy-1,4-benzoquinol methylase
MRITAKDLSEYLVGKRWIPARAGKVLDRAKIRYARYRTPQSELTRRLEDFYSTPDPWELASAREEFRFLRTNDILQQLIAPLPVVSSILEIGCGEGHQSEHLQRLCRQLVGIDVVSSAVERARARVPTAELVVGNLEDQPWLRNRRRFDIVTACEVLYMVRDVSKTLKLMRRLADLCLVTYFESTAEFLNAPLRRIPVEGHASFTYDSSTWHALWWRP